MNYELAKQLKEAGFPLKHPAYHYVRIYERDDEMCNDYALVPTLSELIEACGPTFSELTKMTHTKDPQRWVAVSYSCEECGQDGMFDGRGETPEEAVARLWLALQENKRAAK